MTTKRTINDEEQQQLRKEVHNDATQFKKVFEKGGAPDVGRLVHWANWWVDGATRPSLRGRGSERVPLILRRTTRVFSERQRAPWLRPFIFER